MEVQPRVRAVPTVKVGLKLHLNPYSLVMRVNGNGTLTTVADGLDRPTSVEIINNTAYVVTLGGKVWMCVRRRRA